ncbi:hypothetical protein Q0Z83_109720 [Actinoplanes sichuanensis]|uniref:Carboxypeptidase regulatory-like domain-containing protein n=1 Tax=Actinoplanes sichuanensis TaxID=512349 RepID=A0ABW4A2Q4_9ACTN|nr:carboxypeptidase-like regulatory domain-containing protein [Actinoplanes sichuanensis]BEL12781.1 hypothetical protein Q0Z83_109720 [Actinoplanes sichuanensis]
MFFVSVRRLLATALAVLLAGFLLTTGAAPALADPAAPTGTFEGWVKDPGGLPLEGVTVTLEPGGYQQNSDASGRVLFTDLPVGEYLVSASTTLNGDCPVSRSQLLFVDQYGITFGLTLYTEDGEPCPPPAEPEVPAATLGGLVWGEAVAGVTVTLQPGGLQATTNEWGGFEFPGLAAGTYTLTATAAGGDCGLTASLEAVLGGTDSWYDLFLEPTVCP